MIKAFFSLLTGNLISKGLGFFREVLLAWAYGLSATAAAIRIAMAAVFVPINLLTQELLAAGFIPLFKDYQKQSPLVANQYFTFFLVINGFIGLSISLALWPIAQSWIFLLASGFSESTASMATSLFKPMLFSIPFILATSVFSYRAMAENEYFIQSMRPSIQNIGMIIAIILSVSLNSVVLIGITFLATQIIFCLMVIIWALRKPWAQLTELKQLPWVKFSRKLWQTMKPLLYLPIILQGYIVLERNVASWMGESVVAALDISKFISETSMALLAIPMGLLLLSRFSIEDYGNRQELIEKIIIIVTIIITPAACILVFTPETIIALLFERGNFTVESTNQTATVLRLFGLGLLFQTLNYQLLKLTNAFQLSKLYSQAMAYGLILGAITLLTYKIFNLMVFGLAYLINGTTVTIVLIYQLYSFKTFLWLVSGACFVLILSLYIGIRVPTLPIYQSLAISVLILLIGLTLSMMPTLCKRKPKELILWLLNKSK